MVQLNGTEWDEGEWQRQHSAEVARLREMVDVADKAERVALADLDELSANTVRLREALTDIHFALKSAWDELGYDVIPAAVAEQATAALFEANTDDWLARHDEQVRQEERQSCCDVIRAACQPCGGTGGMEHPDGEASGCPYCGYPIAAIREADDD